MQKFEKKCIALPYLKYDVNLKIINDGVIVRLWQQNFHDLAKV